MTDIRNTNKLDFFDSCLYKVANSFRSIEYASIIRYFIL